MAKTPQLDAQKKAEKIEKLRQFVRQNQGLQRLNGLSSPAEIEKAIKASPAPFRKKKP